MTYILGSLCKDGVTLISDRKIVFDGFNIEYRKKLFDDFYPIIMGASGSISLFDKFRVKALAIANKLVRKGSGDSGDEPIIIENYVEEIENITGELNRRYRSVQLPPLEVLIGAQTQDKGAILYHVYPDGFAEVVPKYRAIGHGEPFGSIFLKNLWRADLNMNQAAQIGYFIVKYIEEFELDTSVGVGNNKPQLWFIPNKGQLVEANDFVINRFEIKTIKWLENFTKYITNDFQSDVTLEEYVVIAIWGSYCDIENGNGCNKAAPGALERGDGQFHYPEGICLDSLGHVYVVEQGNNRIQKFDKNGNFITKWGTKGTQNTQFVTPFAVAIDSQDKIYVSDDGGRIQKFDSNGKFITKWGTLGSEAKQFNSPKEFV